MTESSSIEQVIDYPLEWVFFIFGECLLTEEGTRYQNY